MLNRKIRRPRGLRIFVLMLLPVLTGRGLLLDLPDIEDDALEIATTTELGLADEE